MRLEGKVALITGASQGIGQGIAIGMAKEGADIIVGYRAETDKERAMSVQNEVEALGRKCLIIQADMSKTSEITELVNRSFQETGGVDILVNNAGLEKRAPAWEVTEDDYDIVLDVNLKGVFFVTQGCLKYWIGQKRAGKVINISSVHEELPFPHFSAYCMSKGGVKMMTRNLAIEVAPFGITVNSVAPGAIETPINKNLMENKLKLKVLLDNIPLKRLGQPSDVADAVVYLASSDADYVTGTTLFVDGGLLWNYQEQ